METTFCPKCRMVMPVETYLDSDQCPACGKDFNAASYGMAFGVAVMMAMVFICMAVFSNDPQRWKFAAFMSAAIFLWALLVVATDRLFIIISGMARRARSRISLPVATGVFLFMLFLWGRM